MKPGVKPSIKAIDDWMVNHLDCKRNVVGMSRNHQDIVLYEMDYYYRVPTTASYSGDGNTINNNFLFLSLVHGNEPMGLISLLLGAEKLAKASSLSSRTTSRTRTSRTKNNTNVVKIYFLPVVNVDAYTLNLNKVGGGGCKRTNLETTCTGTSKVKIHKCPNLGIGGVDLNRNFPHDWEGNSELVDDTNYMYCTHDNPGKKPFSEPETRAIAKVVNDKNITHAMSIHSRRDRSGKSCIIYPYTSGRLLEHMPKEDLHRYQILSDHLNDEKQYITGTARETVHYSAGGTTIDWLYIEKNITAFVLEAQPPCNNRWCNLGVYRNANVHAMTMTKFVRLVVVVGGGNDNDDEVMETYYGLTTPPSPYPSLLIVFIVLLLMKRNVKKYMSYYNRVQSLLQSRIRFRKQKEDSPEEQYQEDELLSLKT